MKFKRLKKLLSKTHPIEILGVDGVIETAITKNDLKGNYDEFSVSGIGFVDTYVDEIDDCVTAIEIFLKCSEVDILFQKEKKVCELIEVTLTSFKETTNVNIVDYKNIFITADGTIFLEPANSPTSIDVVLACLIGRTNCEDETEVLEYFSNAYGSIVFNERIDFVCDKYTIVRIGTNSLWIPSEPTNEQLETMRKMQKLKVMLSGLKIICCNSFHRQLWQEKVVSLLEEE